MDRFLAILHVIFRSLRVAFGGPQYSVVPRVYWRMQASQFWIMIALAVFLTATGYWAIRGWSFRSLYFIAFVPLSFLVFLRVLLTLHNFILRRRWKALMTQVRAADYLFCPSCGQDLRGCALENSQKVIAVPAAADDVVCCPECGIRLVVHRLGGAWEVRIPGVNETAGRVVHGVPLREEPRVTCSFCRFERVERNGHRRCPKCWHDGDFVPESGSS